MNIIDRIYPTFGSPYAENPTKKVDATSFIIPQCYSKTNAVLDKKHHKKFPDETLIYMFYNYSEDLHKFIAAEEL